MNSSNSGFQMNITVDIVAKPPRLTVWQQILEYFRVLYR